MTRLFKTLALASMAVLLTTVACASDGVSATAGSDAKLTSEAELSCCQKAAMDDKKECCGKNIEGKYCPMTGQKVEE